MHGGLRFPAWGCSNFANVIKLNIAKSSEKLVLPLYHPFHPNHWQKQMDSILLCSVLKVLKILKGTSLCNKHLTFTSRHSVPVNYSADRDRITGCPVRRGAACNLLTLHPRFTLKFLAHENRKSSLKKAYRHTSPSQEKKKSSDVM